MSAEDKPAVSSADAESAKAANGAGTGPHNDADNGPGDPDIGPDNGPNSNVGTDAPNEQASPENAATRNESDQAKTPQADADGDADVLDFGDARLGPEAVTEPDLATNEQDPVAELAEARARADEHWERVLRMQADMENQRKRAQRDVENARKFALEGIINDLLPIKDSLEMGLAAARETDADASKIIEGSDLTLKMLSQAFEKYNISEVDPVDEKFDPELHQAMSMQEVEGKESNMVTGVLQKGYTLNGRLLRPALVMVAK